MSPFAKSSCARFCMSLVLIPIILLAFLSSLLVVNGFGGLVFVSCFSILYMRALFMSLISARLDSNSCFVGYFISLLSTICLKAILLPAILLMVCRAYSFLSSSLRVSKSFISCSLFVMSDSVGVCTRPALNVVLLLYSNAFVR